MIKLYQFPSCWGLPNASPFCMKLETYLRMAKLPFQVRVMQDPRKAPKGKLPFIKDEGVVIADSGLIIDYLKEKYGYPLDDKLTAVQRAQALALQRLMEEHLYWAVLYSRWVDPLNWSQIKRTFFAGVPLLIRAFVAAMVRKSMRSELHGHGMGRHAKEQVYAMGVNDLRALSALLSEHAFLIGNDPTSIDAAGYAFIANVLDAPIVSPMTDYARSQQCFVDYCARMKALYY